MSANSFPYRLDWMRVFSLIVILGFNGLVVAEAQTPLLLKGAFDEASAEHYAHSCELFHDFYLAHPSYAALAPAERGALDAMRKGLNPDDLMHDITAPNSDATPAVNCSYAFTAYVMYFHDANQAGSQRAAALAMRNYAALHVPTSPIAPAVRSEATRSATLPPGRYSCATFGGSIELQGGGSKFNGGLSSGGNFTISKDRYSFDYGVSTSLHGTYQIDPITKQVRFDGVLAHTFARLSAPSTDGVPSISFPYDQNRTAIDGHPLAGGPMSCYHQH